MKTVLALALIIASCCYDVDVVDDAASAAADAMADAGVDAVASAVFSVECEIDCDGEIVHSSLVEVCADSSSDLDEIAETHGVGGCLPMLGMIGSCPSARCSCLAEVERDDAGDPIPCP
jgi:hypothetical protein